ncbi:hypothetical protein L1887_42450 [Cichorium endivia]|nr:hypothetical protein L1887_42450 [Cichorium endivia]
MSHPACMRIIASRDGTHMLCHPASLRNRVFSHAPPLQAAMHGSLRSLRLELAAHHWSASRKLRLSPAARGVNALRRLQFPRTFALARPAKACAPGSRRRVNTVQGGSAGRRIGQGSEPTHGRLLLAFQHKPGCRSFRSPPIVVAAGQNHLISDSDSISAPVFLVQRTSPSATQVRSEPPSRPRRDFHPMIAFARFDIGDTKPRWLRQISMPPPRSEELHGFPRKRAGPKLSVGLGRHPTDSRFTIIHHHLGRFRKHGPLHTPRLRRRFRPNHFLSCCRFMQLPPRRARLSRRSQIMVVFARTPTSPSWSFDQFPRHPRLQLCRRTLDRKANRPYRQERRGGRRCSTPPRQPAPSRTSISSPRTQMAKKHSARTLPLPPPPTSFSPCLGCRCLPHKMLRKLPAPLPRRKRPRSLSRRRTPSSRTRICPLVSLASEADAASSSKAVRETAAARLATTTRAPPSSTRAPKAGRAANEELDFDDFLKIEPCSTAKSGHPLCRRAQDRCRRRQ